MSLINEALKRTRDTAYQSAQASPPMVPEYQLENRAKSEGTNRLLVAMGISGVGVLAGIIGLAFWIVPRIQRVEDSFTVDRQVAIEAAKPTVIPVPVPAAVPAPAPATPAAESKASEDQIVAKVMERIKTQQPAAPATPQLQLQGITYAPDNRDAMINGVTVHEGEVIEGARVVTIDARRVTLDLQGQEIVLRLP